jgi:hypothetical protein
MSWGEADEVTTRLLVVLDEYPVSLDHKLQALVSAREALIAARDLEQELEKKAEYANAGGSAMMKIRDKV